MPSFRFAMACNSRKARTTEYLRLLRAICVCYDDLRCELTLSTIYNAHTHTHAHTAINPSLEQRAPELALWVIIRCANYHQSTKHLISHLCYSTPSSRISSLVRRERKARNFEMAKCQFSNGKEITPNDGRQIVCRHDERLTATVIARRQHGRRVAFDAHFTIWMCCCVPNMNRTSMHDQLARLHNNK